MERYSEYKDSGVEWLGEIPRHWELRKMKFSFEERSQKGFPTLPLLAATQNHGVIRKSDYENRTVEATKSLDTLKLVEVGDFVISLRSFQGGIELCHDRGIISPAYTILKPTHIKSCYFKYLGKSPVYLQLLKSMVTGIREGQNIDYGKLRENLIPIPTEAEQEAIANYLDKVTSKIDAAIAQQQKMIELLNERKQIIINNAVTKGLDPTAKMKPSGIPWLGNIPAHWELFRLKYLFTGYKAGPFGSSLITNALLEDGSILVYTPEHVAEQRSSIPNNLYLPENRRNELKKFFVKKGDVIFPIVGSLGRAMIIEEAMPEGIINQRLAMFSIRKEFLDTDYFMWVFGKSKFYESYIKNVQRGSFIVNLTKTLVGDMPFVLPPINEQKEISIFITNKTTEILSSISCIEKQIGLLQERKQIIINDIVTGKVKVI